MSLSVRIDTSFVVPVIKYLSNPSKELMLEIKHHEAAKKTHAHAVRFGNTKKNVNSFWKDILKDLSRKKNLISIAKGSLNYIYNELDLFNKLLKDLWEYFPEGTELSTNLYAILGYDIGIVSEGNALINLGHPDFEKDTREILLMAMHELHHVVYTAYNPIFDFTKTNTTSQLVDVMKYSAHMEGMAVYSLLEQRKSMNALNNRDYKLLLDDKAKSKRVSTYFDILTKFEIRGDNPLQEKDWKILERMTGRDRLWYVAGAHMAQIIDKNFGRETLLETIRLGPDDFFMKYHETF